MLLWVRLPRGALGLSRCRFHDPDPLAMWTTHLDRLCLRDPTVIHPHQLKAMGAFYNHCPLEPHVSIGDA